MRFDYDNAVTRAEALELLDEHWDPHRETEEVSLGNAFGRVTAEPYTSQLSLPVVRSSKCDGIAVHSSDFADGVPDTSGWIRDIDFAQADTGDDFDDAFDAVIAIENVQWREDGTPSFIGEDLEVKPGRSINPKGANIQEGDLIVPAHKRLTPANVSILAMGGYTEVDVVKKPIVAFIPTGNELVAAGTIPERGQTIESNSLLVRGMLQEFGATPLIHGIVRDDREALEAALDETLKQADIVLINGGSSRGEEDFNSKMLEERASFFRHGIKAVPGRPIGIAIIDGKPVINVPGPAIAAFLCMNWLVRGLMDIYYQFDDAKPPTVSARLNTSMSKPEKFERIFFVDLTQEADGSYSCDQISPSSSAGMFLNPDGVAYLPIGRSDYSEGEEVTVELYS